MGERDTEACVVTIMRPLHPHAGDLETGGELAHLGLDHLLRLPQRLVARGEDQVLEHLRILGVDDLAVDLDREQLLLAVALDGDHAAARRRVDFLLGDFLLQRLHLLLQLLRLLHDVAEAFHWTSPSSGTRGRTATTSPWNVDTAACTAGWLTAPVGTSPSVAISTRRAPGICCCAAWVMISRFARSPSISRWKALATRPTVSTPPSSRCGTACWTTEPRRAFFLKISSTARVHPRPRSPSLTGSGSGACCRGGRGAATGAGTLEPDTGGVARGGASSRLGCATTGRASAGAERSRLAASSIFAIRPSMAS